MPSFVSWTNAARSGGVLFCCVAACARGESSTPEPGPARSMMPAGPVVTRVVPDSGWAGPDYPIRATLHGTGFMEAGNVVVFGPVRIADLPGSDGGTRITFSVPKQRPATGEVPPMVLQPGEYEVTVTTDQGTSEPVRFRLTNPGGETR